MDLIYGALFFRLLMGHAPLSATFVRQVLADVLEGLATKGTEAAKPHWHAEKIALTADLLAHPGNSGCSQGAPIALLTQ